VKFKKIHKTFLPEQVFFKIKYIGGFFLNLKSKSARSTLTSPGSNRVHTVPPLSAAALITIAGLFQHGPMLLH
jgi:hypothetical protein